MIPIFPFVFVNYRDVLGTRKINSISIDGGAAVNFGDGLKDWAYIGAELVKPANRALYNYLTVRYEGEAVGSISPPSVGGDPPSVASAPQCDLTSNDGTYKGTCKNGRPDGWGVTTSKNGNVIEGMSRDGVLTGPIKITYPDGKIYEVNFKDGKPDGSGVLTMKNGTTKICTISNGKCQ